MNAAILPPLICALILNEVVLAQVTSSSTLSLRGVAGTALGLALLPAAGAGGLILALSMSAALVLWHPHERLRQFPVSAALLFATPLAVSAICSLQITGLGPLAWDKALAAVCVSLAVILMARAISPVARAETKLAQCLILASALAAIMGEAGAVWLLCAIPSAVAVLPRMRVARGPLLTVAAMLVPALAFNAQAGPWALPQGQSLIIARTSVETAQGEGDPARTASVYSETGVAEGLTALKQVWLQEREGETQRAGGHAGLRWQVMSDGPWAAGLTATAGINGTDPEAPLPAFGDAAFGTVSASLGWSGEIAGLESFAFAEASYQRALGDEADLRLASVEGGVHLDADWSWLARVEVSSGGEGRGQTVYGQTSLLMRVVDDVNVELGVGARMEDSLDTQVQGFASVWVRF